MLLTCDIMTVIWILFYLILFSCQQFFAWFANVEAQMEEEQESSYRYNILSLQLRWWLVRNWSKIQVPLNLLISSGHMLHNWVHIVITVTVFLKRWNQHWTICKIYSTNIYLYPQKLVLFMKLVNNFFRIRWERLFI